MDLKRSIELSNLAKSQIKAVSRQRKIATLLSQHSERSFLGLLGPRGAGKTILLKQMLSKNPLALYLSVDSLPPDSDLFELVKEANQSYGFTLFLLDEVHFNVHINAHLKKIFDFLDVQLFFSSSVALKMHESAHDLSRRVRLITVPYFSFREYLEFHSLASPSSLRLSELLAEKGHPDYAIADQHFHAFLQGGMLPFALEVAHWKDALKNIVHKIIFDDLPRIHRLPLQELLLIEKSLSFIGKSSVDGINPTSLSKNLSISRYKASQYLALLEQAFLVRLVLPKGTNVLREPKVLLSPPIRLLHQSFDDAIGGLREDFAVDMLLRLNLEPTYLKSARGKKLPDYFLDFGSESVLLEIGGPGKGDAQLRSTSERGKAFVLKDGAPYDETRRPLSVLGLCEA